MTERGILRQLIEQAFTPYIDPTLEGRVTRAAAKWQRQAQAAVDEQVDAEVITRLQGEVDDLRSQAESINDD